MVRKDETARAIAQVEGITRRYRSAVVAYSGGVDSSLLACLSNGAIKTLALIADSPSVPRRELENALSFAREHGIECRTFKAEEMSDPGYVANRGDRCYHCKREIYGKMVDIARSLGYEVVMDGTNADDLKDDRPGLMAARELGIVFPFCEAKVTKRQIREMSKRLGLRTWDKPSSPCLSSRIPVGKRVTKEALERVERAEELLRSVGFRVVRVRDDPPEARVELDVVDVDRVKEISDMIKALGYDKVLVSKDGYVEPQKRGKRKGKGGFHEV